MKRFWQVCRFFIPVSGVAFFLFMPSISKSDEISRQCNDTNLDLNNALRACDVVIGRQNTSRAKRIRAFQVRAKVHLAAGNITASLNDLTSAIAALPDGRLKGYVLFLRAQTRFDYVARTEKTITASLADLERADTLAPANPRIIEILARVYGFSGQYSKAIDRATRVLNNDPRALIARKIRARAYETLGQNRNAIRDLDSLLARTRGDSTLLAWRGRLHEKRRNVVKALADYRNAARISTTQELLDGIKRLERILQKR